MILDHEAYWRPDPSPCGNLDAIKAFANKGLSVAMLSSPIFFWRAETGSP
ncbi:MAG: hypothetical protein ACE5Z5_13975 [Candidatus Bathyarchaeia archaeon]